MLEFDETKELANPQDLKSFLSKEATRNYTPGFTKIEINKTGTFTSESFGSGDEITAIILSIEPTRALYPFGTDQEEKAITDWLGRENVPLCAARGDDCLAGRGSIIKPLDDAAPPLVRTLLEPIIVEERKCMAGQDKGCPWSAFGSSGAGMACKENRRLLVWNPANGVYGLLGVTSTSLKSFRHYLSGLPNGDYTNFLTTFSLEKQSKGKYKWCTLKFNVAGEITNDMLAPLAAMVSYQGRDMMQAQAVISEFLRLDFDLDTDLPIQNGTDATEVETGENVPDDF